MKALYPMDMDEFMLALSEDDLVEQIKNIFRLMHRCCPPGMTPQYSSNAHAADAS